MRITSLEGFTASDDGRFRCLSRTLPDNTFVCVTDLNGLDYPHETDFMVCAYVSEKGFYDDGACLASIGSWENVSLADAIGIVIARSAEAI
jgi:hypothetical protein